MECLTVARIDVCGLANNHVLDYGYAGLAETIAALTRVGLKAVGAGRHLAAAREPAVVPVADGTRVIVFAFGVESSGIPLSWAAREDRAGIDLLADLSESTAAAIVERVRRVKGHRDLVVASIHWGSNWGHDCIVIPRGSDMTGPVSLAKPIELQLSANALEVLRARYLNKDERGRVAETPAEMFRRVAAHVADVEPRYGGDSHAAADAFYRAMVQLEFLPNSPALMNAGTRVGQLAACFVLPIDDSLDHTSWTKGSFRS